MKRSTSKSPTTKGWGVIFEDPIPGDVPKCLHELGIEVTRMVNEEAAAACPAHYERTGKERSIGDWSVNTESGEHNCFSCGFRGNFVSLVQFVLKCSLEDAVLWVKARGSIDRAKKILYGAGEYVQNLKDEPEIVITEADLALYDQVPEWACDNRDLDPKAVDFYGILWDSKKDRWITPIRHPETHRLMGWQEKGEEHRFFRNYPREVKKATTLFGVREFAKHRPSTAILVESPLDCPRIFTAGVDPEDALAVSSFGAWVSDDQLDVLVMLGVRLLICALDNDPDGIKAADEMRKRVRGRMRLRYWNYADSDAKDPGDQSDEEILESYQTAYSSVLWKRG
jgi:hypothetical protein